LEIGDWGLEAGNQNADGKAEEVFPASRDPAILMFDISFPQGVAESRADFVAKMRIVEEKRDEFINSMGLLMQTGIINEARLHALMGEAGEILAMVVTAIKTARTSR
jgi:hypothetical protein